MASNFNKLFLKIGRVTAPAALSRRVVEAIELDQKRLARRKVIISSLGFLISLGALVPLTYSLVQDVNSSGFFQYFSLIITDPVIIINSWKSFILALLEITPVISLAFSLSCLIILLESLRSFGRYYPIAAMNFKVRPRYNGF